MNVYSQSRLAIPAAVTLPLADTLQTGDNPCVSRLRLEVSSGDIALSLYCCLAWSRCFQCWVISSLLHRGASLVFLLKPVLGPFPYLFCDCTSDVSQRGELLRVYPYVASLSCRLSFLVSLLIPFNTHVSSHTVDLYCHLLFSYLLGSCNDTPCQSQASFRYCVLSLLDRCLEVSPNIYLSLLEGF